LAARKETSKCMGERGRGAAPRKAGTRWGATFGECAFSFVPCPRGEESVVDVWRRGAAYNKAVQNLPANVRGFKGIEGIRRGRPPS